MDVLELYKHRGKIFVWNHAEYTSVSLEEQPEESGGARRRAAGSRDNKEQQAGATPTPHSPNGASIPSIVFFLANLKVLRAAEKRLESGWISGCFQNTPGRMNGRREPNRTGTLVLSANQQRPGHVTTQAPPAESACTEAHI